MASTAHSDPEMMAERHDTPDVLAAKVNKLVEMVASSEHMVSFTGAGISTSAGIPDFRGPTGKWTRQAQGMAPVKGVDVVQAYPTPTHMALLELYNQGVLKYLISQNCDGLHRRSGFPAAGISELHGNCWVEICEACGQQYARDYKCLRVVRPGGAQCPADHFTGRFCGCGGRLLNSTIDFGQSLPRRPLKKAAAHSKQADLHLALGSSLTVSPACDQPLATVRTGGQLVIVNLQKTPHTPVAAMHIFAPTDVVMQMLMERLGMTIPEFRLLRRVVVGRSVATRGPVQVYAKSVDVHDPSVETDHIASTDWAGGAGQRGLNAVAPTLHFWGHYREPALRLTADLSNSPMVDMSLAYNPYQGTWELLSQEEVPGGELRAPDVAEEWRIPDYGPSHREYCIQAVMKHRGCSEEEATRIVDQRIAEALRAVQGARRASAPRRFGRGRALC